MANGLPDYQLGPGGKPIYNFGSSLGGQQDAARMNGYRQESVGQGLVNQGFDYNPVTGQWGRTPTAAGSRQYDYSNSATGGALGALQGMFGGAGGSLPGVGGVGGVGGGVSVGGVGGTGTGSPANTGHVQPPDMTAANTAVFSRAKDQAGALARASLNSLNGEAGASGMIGSGAHQQAQQNIIGQGAGALEDVNNQQAITNAGQNADFAKLNYTGDITQRGQDIQKQEADAQLASANLDRYLRMMTSMMSMYGGGVSTQGGAVYNP